VSTFFGRNLRKNFRGPQIFVIGRGKYGTISPCAAQGRHIVVLSLCNEVGWPSGGSRIITIQRQSRLQAKGAAHLGACYGFLPNNLAEKSDRTGKKLTMLRGTKGIGQKIRLFKL
jgi:hypothetical protein